MKRTSHIFLNVTLVILTILLASCQKAAEPLLNESEPTVVVTYSVLGAVVSDLVGDQANVVVLIPNGQDLHDWEPSARDIEMLTNADLIVKNGLDLEGGLDKALAEAVESGVPVFTAADHITIRIVGAGEGIPTGDPDQAVGAQDPHLWMDPLAMRDVVSALSDVLTNSLGLDVSARALELENRLEELSNMIAEKAAVIPSDQRKLVTGHESMGYFADRFDFKVIGAIIPSLSTQAEVSASDLSTLKEMIEQEKVLAIFTELGTPSAVAETIGQETGVQVVMISTHTLPDDGSYFTFMIELSDAIINALK